MAFLQAEGTTHVTVGIDKARHNSLASHVDNLCSGRDCYRTARAYGTNAPIGDDHHPVFDWVGHRAIDNTCADKGYASLIGARGVAVN